MTRHETTYRCLLLQACHKLAEASGAISALGNATYALEFRDLARDIRAQMSVMERDALLDAEIGH